MSANKKYDKCVKSVKINEHAFNALIDMGRIISLVRASAYIQLGCPRFELKEIRFRGIGAVGNSTLGEFNTELTIDDCAHSILVRVVPNTLINQDLLVGTDFLNSVELTIKAGRITVKFVIC